MVSLVLVVDQPLLNHGIRCLLDTEKSINITGEASSGVEAVSMYREVQPDVILIDIQLPGFGGFEATRRILKYAPEARVIMLGASDQPAIIHAAMEIGAFAVVCKHGECKQLINAIRKTSSGQRYLCPFVAQKIALSAIKGGDSAHWFKSPTLLTARELEVVRLIAEKNTVSKIASLLNVSKKTVNGYRYRIFDKLQIQTDVEITLIAIQYGIIKPPQVMNDTI